MAVESATSFAVTAADAMAVRVDVAVVVPDFVYSSGVVDEVPAVLAEYCTALIFIAVNAANFVVAAFAPAAVAPLNTYGTR